MPARQQLEMPGRYGFHSIRGKFVVARRHPTTLLDPIEEPFDPVAGAIKKGLKQIGSLRLLFDEMSAHAPFLMASSLIQSASYPRSASSIDPGFRRERSLLASRLS
jgi:hypothetical protein